MEHGQNSGLWRAGLTHHLLFFLTWWSAHIHVTWYDTFIEMLVWYVWNVHILTYRTENSWIVLVTPNTWCFHLVISDVTVTWLMDVNIHSVWFYVFPGFYNKLKMCVETTGSCLYDEDDRNNNIKSAVFLLRLLVYRFIYTSWTVFTCTCTHRLLSQHVYQWTLPVFVFR